MLNSSSGVTAPFEDDDARIEKALQDAHIPSLINALVHLTGDTELLRGAIRPEAGFFGDPQAGISPAQQQQIRALALEALISYRDRGCTLPSSPSPETIQEMMHFLIARELPEDYVEFLIDELSLEGEDPYATPELGDLPEAQRAGFQVLIVGAGMSGILAAIRLKEHGIPFTIVEKNQDVGGTWLENTYPGCRVDSSNHVYSYTFQSRDWPQYFSQQSVLLEYFRDCAEKYDIRDQIRFGWEVTEAHYDDETKTWRIQIRDTSGRTEALASNALITAVGQLNRPRYPEIPGRNDFKGISFHSARWEHQHELKGKRIAVIGTGASAFQFVPEIAPDASNVSIFQRTPPWVSPTPEYHENVPEGKHWLLKHVPFYAKWYRFWLFWMTAEGLLDMVRKDPAWNDTGRSISPANEELRQMLSAYITQQVGDDTDLLQKTLPDYPPGGKRMLRDDGLWIQTLRRNNVSVITDPITAIDESGLITADGSRHEVDVIIYGTGFQASHFLSPMKIYGQRGIELHEHWQGDPRAYLGITVPGYPNLFCLYGPNTNIVVNGSIIFFSECEVRYILGCLGLLLKQGVNAMDCKQTVHDRFNERIDAGNQLMAWGMPEVRSWYKNDAGRVTQNWPFTLREFWSMTRRPDPEDFIFSEQVAE